MTQFEKTVSWMKKPWVMGVYAIFVVLAYSIADRPVATFFYQLNIGTKLPLLAMLTALGKWTVYAILLFSGGLYFRYIRINPVYEIRTWYLLGCVLVANFICLVLKVALSRARPDLLFSSNEFGFYWFQLKGNYWSFPSGHVTTVVSLAAGLGVIFSRYFYVFLVLACFIAATRVLLCFHYLSDVMIAFYLTLLVVSFFTDFFKKKIGPKKWVLLCNNDIQES